MAHTLASTSSSASAHSNYSYDVFLSHRGKDVKKTFASHLYRRLLPYGVRVFLDQQEMERGEEINPQIEGAIETASVHVAIFSPGYADSRWCLDELVLMLKSGATIIPVFYNVKPLDLRWTDKSKYTDRVYAEALRILRQTGRYRVFVHALRILRLTGKDGVYVQALKNLLWTGSDRVYAKALLNHEKKGRYGQEILAAWRKALAEVSYLSGFELESCNGDEGELVDEIVRQVHKKVRKAPLHVAKHPTGLDEKLQHFERTVSLEEPQHREGTILLGITGLGGVGKTTLAKEFFNKNRSHYQRSCFLAEVRDAAARNTLTSLQGQLCEDLTGVPRVMRSISEGIGELTHLSYSQSLIILDDVDHDEQLEALFSPLKHVLPSGSLILVTSRDKGVLRKRNSAGIQESSIYNMTGLSWENSRDLFCSHAFHQPYPDVGYEELVSKFLRACQGLPLSLKVIGALLHSESPEYWKDQWHKLDQVLPTDIQNRLKISYDSLDKQEKEIFLDIACFFIGIKRDTAIRLWDRYGWKGSLGLGTLETKCLVTLDEENCIRMHDHLRDLGRDLAEKEPPGCPRRLWRPTDNLFHDVPTQSTVRGISMVQQRYGESFQSTAEFSNRIFDISGLQLLRAPCDCLESLFKVVIHPYILWLRCEIYSSLPSWIQINNSDSSLPSWIPIKNLIVLELLDQQYRRPGSPMPILGTLWNTESEAPLQLRELNISCELFHLPKSIEQLKYLEKIELPNFKGTLPEEFFHLPSLKHLRLRAGMKSLPDSLGNFTNLQHIDLSGCEDLQTLPPSFGKLTKLQHVKLKGCGKLKMLPDSFMNLIRLKHLDLSDCYVLTLSGQTLGNISTLERLNFFGCHKIEVLAPQVTHQQSLEELIMDHTQLKELPSAIGDLRQLTSLSIRFCPISVLPFASVEKVQGGRSRLLDSSIDMCMLRLNSLNLSHTRITEISFGKGVCPVLESLDLQGCLDLVEVGALPTTLTSLDLNCCWALKKISGLRGLAKLRSLNMSGCKEIEEQPGLGVWELNNLEQLDLMECPISVLPFASVEKVQGGRRFLDSSIDSCMLRLKSLILSKTRITEISFGEGVCPVLQLLDLEGCDDLVEVGALPTTLTSLSLTDCCALKKITGLRGLAKLRYLSMSGCKEIEELPGLGVRELNNLENLCLRECPISVLPFASVEKVQGGRRFLDSSIDKCMLRLKSLSLSKTRITEISFGEGVCPVLQSLYLAGCDDLVEVGALPTTLTSLDLSDCCALKKITGLRGLAKLRDLNMSRCKEIEELPGLGVWELNNLENLYLRECPISVLPFASVEKVQGGRRFLDSSIDECMLRLKSLTLSKTRITEISFGEGVCPVLERLDLAGCDDLVEVGALPTTLTILYLKDCSALRKITGLRGLAKLHVLNMAGCYTVEELPGLETLISVEVLLTPECENMKRIRELAEAANPESYVLKKVIQIWKETIKMRTGLISTIF